MLIETMNFLGNMCVVLITVYTVYLTFYSKRIKVVSCGLSSSIFASDQIHLSLHSYTMQSFEVREVSFIFEDKSVRIALQEPYVIEPRMTTKVLTKSFTRLADDIDIMDVLLGGGSGESFSIHRTVSSIAPTGNGIWGSGRGGIIGGINITGSVPLIRNMAGLSYQIL